MSMAKLVMFEVALERFLHQFVDVDQAWIHHYQQVMKEQLK